MKAISFCLYGGDPKYCVGAAKNIFLARYWYPDWTCVFYVDNSVPKEVIDYLKAAGALVKDVGSTSLGPMFWRFLIHDEPDVERYIIRDCDSRIGGREVAAVNEWINSGLKFHVMRDHPHHKTGMMGGMWGCEPHGPIPNMKQLIDSFKGPTHGYDADQAFLREKIWPVAKESVLQHDTCHRSIFLGGYPYRISRQFPTPLAYNNLRFVGEVFDENDQPRPYAWEQLFDYV